MKPTEHILQDAMIRNLDDEVARAAYADWLDENDRPNEAEYIRVLGELRKCGPKHKQCRQFTTPMNASIEALTLMEAGPNFFTAHVMEWRREHWKIGDRVDLLDDGFGGNGPKLFWRYGLIYMGIVEQGRRAGQCRFKADEKTGKRWPGGKLDKRAKDLWQAMHADSNGPFVIAPYQLMTKPGEPNGEDRKGN